MNTKPVFLIAIGYIFAMSCRAQLAPPSLDSGQPNGPDDAAVAAFFPQALTDLALSRNANPADVQRDFGYAAVSLEGAGAPRLIVAAYTDYITAAVLVLRKNASGQLSVAAAPQFSPVLHGIGPAVSGADIDGDGREEALVWLGDGKRQPSLYVLKWTGMTLVSIGPMNQYGGSDLYRGDLVDLEGDGKMELLGYTGPSGYIDQTAPPQDSYAVYELQSGRYAPRENARTPISVERYVRATGQPAIKARKFVVTRAGFQLLVVNGDGGGSRVSSGTIKLNGVQVVGPNQFGQQVATITVPITVQAVNTIEVQLEGQMGGQIAVLVLAPQ
jgi:hypothetical protein